MDDIETCLANIMTAVYGEEVRTSIHDAIKQLYDESVAVRKNTIIVSSDICIDQIGIALDFVVNTHIVISDEMMTHATEKLIELRALMLNYGIPIFLRTVYEGHRALLIENITVYGDDWAGGMEVYNQQRGYAIHFRDTYNWVEKKHRYPIMYFIPKSQHYEFSHINDYPEMDYESGVFEIQTSELRAAGINVAKVKRIELTPITNASLVVSQIVDSKPSTTSGTVWEPDTYMDFSGTTKLSFQWDPEEQEWWVPTSIAYLKIDYDNDTNDAYAVFEDGQITIRQISQQDYEDLDVKDPDTLYVIPDENV